VGQYAIYRSLIQATEPTYQLYLAIDDIPYENFFKHEGIAFIIRLGFHPRGRAFD
jgi:hypothetical protein